MRMAGGCQPPPHTTAGPGGLGACLPWRGALAWSAPLDRSDARAVGRWGEALVYNFLRAAHPPAARRVEWLNETEESRAPYDLRVTSRAAGGGGGVPTFIEVKTTRHRDHNAFELSWGEWDFLSREPPVRFHIYRVSGAGDPGGARITIIEEPLRLIQDRTVRLCLSI